MSDEKVSPDAAYNSHDEKLPQPNLVDETERRASVALNIVENPLKVSF
jgi:hypothetical protein